jgi:hypothetical protein
VGFSVAVVVVRLNGRLPHFFANTTSSRFAKLVIKMQHGTGEGEGTSKKAREFKGSGRKIRCGEFMAIHLS